jgi:hypothetical protein
MAYFDIASQNVKTLKFTSKGMLMQTAESKVEVQPREGSDSEDNELKSEQLKQMDYGYRERAIVLPEDDCFTKL